MVIVGDGVNNEIEELKMNVGTEIEVRPEGQYGGFSKRGSQSYLSENLTDDIEPVEHIYSISRSLSVNYQVNTSEDDQEEDRRGIFNFVFINGIDPETPMVIFGGGTADVKYGQYLSEYGPNDDVAIMGLNYSEENSLELNDKITINETDVVIVGIFESGSTFGDRIVFLPIETAQRILGKEYQVSTITVTVDSVENIEYVDEKLKEVLLEEEVDVVPQSESDDDLIQSYESISQNSEIGAILALVVGCIIVFFTMILVTRERRREIGTLKALGASGKDILKQFMIEAMVIAIIAAIVGLLLASIGGQAIASIIIGDSTADNSDMPDNLPPEMQEGWKQRQSQGGGFSSGNENEDSDVISTISYSFSSTSIVYALAVAILLAGLGVLYPSVQGYRMKPVEALRHE